MANENHCALRIDRIYIDKNLSNQVFEWVIGTSLVPTDHWMVQVKYTPNAAPLIGQGRWTWPLASLEDEKLMKKIEKWG
jgi:hypothetical protein